MIDETKQYTEALGADFSPPDLRDYKIDKSSLSSEFPEEFALKMPPVKNQGFVGSCVAHSICLVAEYYNSIQHNINAPLSVGYIYGNRVPPLDTRKGMVTRYAISNFCIDGTPFETDFPLHCEVPEIIEAVQKEKDALHDAARNARFTSYVKVSSEKEIKTALMDGNPIIIAVDWQKDMRVKDGKFYSSWKEKSCGHAMVIYGWDKDGWKVQNSQGILWGNKGTAVWPYEYKIREHYAIIDTETTKLNIKHPHSAQTKFGKWLVSLVNKIYSVAYGFWYKIKH